MCTVINSLTGVSHGDYLGYTIKWSVTEPDETQEDRKMSQFLIDIRSSYAHNGQVTFFTYRERMLQKSDNYTGERAGWARHSQLVPLLLRIKSSHVAQIYYNSRVLFTFFSQISKF
jgi:hypothetical protein